MKKLLIAIPIINEKKNIILLLRNIFKSVTSCSILYIDDSSNDGSQKLIERLMNKRQNIFLLKRNKRLGIGSAHKAAIDWAYKNEFEYLITIDGDCTHEPKYMIDIIKYLSSNEYDVVNTTRFKQNQSLLGWSKLRISLTSLRYYLVCFLLNTKLDSSSGYRGFNLNNVKKKDLLKSKNNSYFFLIESLFLLERLNYKIIEIGNKLNSRKAGVSKLNMKHFVNAIFSLVKLFIRYKFNKV